MTPEMLPPKQLQSCPCTETPRSLTKGIVQAIILALAIFLVGYLLGG